MRDIYYIHMYIHNKHIAYKTYILHNTWLQVTVLYLFKACEIKEKIHDSAGICYQFSSISTVLSPPAPIPAPSPAPFEPIFQGT